MRGEATEGIKPQAREMMAEGKEECDRIDHKVSRCADPGNSPLRSDLDQPI